MSDGEYRCQATNPISEGWTTCRIVNPASNGLARSAATTVARPVARGSASSLAPEVGLKSSEAGVCTK